MVARLLCCLLLLALSANCGGKSSGGDGDGDGTPGDGDAGDGRGDGGSDGATDDGNEGPGDGDGAPDASTPEDAGGDADGGFEEAYGEFFTSFESLDPQPSWANSVETGADGAAKTQGVNGSGDRLPGSITEQVTSTIASGENPPGERATDATDGQTTTKWLVFSSTGWIQVDLTRPVVVTRYAITSANDASERDPRSWTFEGYDEQTSSWVPLDTQTDQSFADRFVTKVYDFTNSVAYGRYRLSITANQGGDILQLAEWELSTGDSAGSVTPMRSDVGAGPGASYNAKLRAGFTGVRAFRYAGRVTATGRGYSYNRVFDVDLKVSSRSELSYLIFPDQTLDDASYASTYAAIDLAFDDGSYLSDLGARDQQHAIASPSAQGASKTLFANEWNRKVVDLGAVAAGKTIKRILVGFDHPAGPVSFGGWVDDIAIGLAKPRPRHLSDYVITTRGTHSGPGYSRGNNFPATALPQGFNFWTPVTNAGSDQWFYTYHRDNDADNLPRLEALGLSHQPSPWMGDRQSFQVMPSRTTGVPPAGRAARALAFRHENEIARPYYYGVTFENGIQAELAPTDHAAFFRFTFPSNDASLVFDHINDQAGLSLDAEERSLSFYTDAKSGLSAGATRMFVYAVFDKPVAQNGMLAGEGGGAATGYFRFTIGASDRTVNMRIATSLISLEQAKKNLSLEIAETDDFVSVRDRAQAIWDERLSVIEVEGANVDERTTLYSNLYRLFLYPNSASENVGTAANPSWRYASPVNALITSHTPTQTGARVNTGKIYVNNGFWDTYRSAWPAYALLAPTQAGELIDGFVQQYKDGGWISRWSSPGYADLMTGTSSEVAFADAYLKGITHFDVKSAFDAALRSAMSVPPNGAVGRKGQDTTIFRGWTSTSSGQGMSWAMAGYLNDYGIGNLAAALAETGDARAREYAEYAEYFLERSRNYVHMFDPSVGFFQGKNDDGTWRVSPGAFDARDWGNDYTETNAWNMAFDAPHDPQGLANLYGGRQALANKLDEFFATPERADHTGGYGGVIHEMIEARDVRMGQLGLSNQPSFHIPYMYVLAGQPAKTQAKVREALGRLWVGSEIGQGYLGDDDNGATSSWQIFSALGLFPLQVGSPRYVFGSPLFTKATIHLENGADIVINAPANSPENVYVQSLKVNGQNHAAAYITHEQLKDGAVLDFVMGPTASSWGTGADALPPSLTQGNAAPAPLADVTLEATGVSASDATVVTGLFDDTSATRVTFTGANPSLFVTFARAEQVTFYTLSSGTSQADPTGFTLSGSNDGTTWVQLDQRTGQTFPWRSQTRVFKVGRPGAYTRYRLTLVSAAATSLSEVELLAAP